MVVDSRSRNRNFRSRCGWFSRSIRFGDWVLCLILLPRVLCVSELGLCSFLQGFSSCDFKPCPESKRLGTFSPKSGKFLLGRLCFTSYFVCIYLETGPRKLEPRSERTRALSL